MPGIKGIRGPEIKLEAESRIEIKEIDRLAEPFVYPTTPKMGGSHFESSRPAGLPEFLAIGERIRASDALTINTSQSIAPAPPVTVNEGSAFQAIRKSLTNFFKTVFAGSVAPIGTLMIFRSLLGDGVRVIENKEVFSDTLKKYDTELLSFDRAKAQRAEGWKLNKELNRALQDPRLIALDRERFEFVKKNTINHTLDSIFTHDSTGAEILKPESQSQFEYSREDPKNGPRFYFGNKRVFPDQKSLLKFAEEVLEQNYLWTFPWERPSVPDWANPLFSPNGQHLVPDVVNLEPPLRHENLAGKRLVLRLSFPVPIGREGLLKIEANDVVEGTVEGANGRYVDAEPRETYEMVIVGGPDPQKLGHFRLEDVSAGSFAYRRHEPDFWREHALIENRSGAKRGIYNSWLFRREGMEIPVDKAGQRYALELYHGGQVPKGSSVVRFKPWNGMLGQSLPGDFQVMMEFDVIGGKGQSISLKFARNQSSHFAMKPDQTYLLTPMKKEYALPRGLLGSQWGFYGDQLITGSSAYRELPKPQDEGPYRSAAPHRVGAEVRGYSKRDQPMTIFRIEAMPESKSHENESRKPDVYLLRHMISGEMMIRIHGVKNLSKNLEPMDLTLSPEEAFRLGAIYRDPQGKLYAGPHLEQLYAENWVDSSHY